LRIFAIVYQIDEECFSVIANLISPKANANITKIPSLEEIKQVAFTLG